MKRKQQSPLVLKIDFPDSSTTTITVSFFIIAFAMAET